MIDNPYSEFIKEEAKKQDADPNIIAAICKVESNFDIWANRFEPAFLRKYVPTEPKIFGAVTRATERQGRAFSWGLMQIMGQVAREKGFKGVFLTELCEPLENLKWGIKHWKYCLKIRKGDIQKALLRWNGGGNPHYPFKVLELVGPSSAN